MSKPVAYQRRRRGYAGAQWEDCTEHHRSTNYWEVRALYDHQHCDHQGVHTIPSAWYVAHPQRASGLRWGAGPDNAEAHIIERDGSKVVYLYAAVQLPRRESEGCDGQFEHTRAAFEKWAGYTDVVRPDRYYDGYEPANVDMMWRAWCEGLRQPRVPLQWTKERPTQPGAYWVRGTEAHAHKRTSLIEVREWVDGLRCSLYVDATDEVDAWLPVARLTSPYIEFYGPIGQQPE